MLTTQQHQPTAHDLLQRYLETFDTTKEQPEPLRVLLAATSAYMQRDHLRGIECILQERLEQVDKHHRTVDSDLVNNLGGELEMAAAWLLDPAANAYPLSWSPDFAEKAANFDDLKRLSVAGALIAAQIDMLLANADAKEEQEAHEAGQPGGGYAQADGYDIDEVW